MENIHQVLKTDFILIGKSVNNQNILAFHKVKNEQIQAEIPFTKKIAQAIFSVFNQYDFEPKTFKNLIDENIHLAIDKPNNTKLLFAIKPQKRKIIYDGKHKMKTNTFNLPKLIFFFNNGTVKVFATLNEKITENTKLFYAPFFNVYPNGNVCFGNVELKKIQSIKFFETMKIFITNAFFNSIFTHSNNAKITEEYLLNTNSWNDKTLFDTKLTIKDII